MNRYKFKEKKQLDIKQKDGYLVLKHESFNPKDIFECGQVFNFNKEDDGSYTAVFKKQIINVLKKQDEIIIKNVDEETFYEYFYDYFDLGVNYERIRSEISKDELIKKACDYGKGIRILNQDMFETIISFIISANNQIPRIKKAVRIISERYGKYLGEFNGRKYYSFPEAYDLKNIDPMELREYASVGFRDKRIVEVAKILSEGYLDFNRDIKLDSNLLQEKLMKLPGVGPKVSDCILLFAFHKRNSFPVDVWIKRVMEHLFIKEEVSKKEVLRVARELFGENAGYVQQYLFYYAREEKIGK